MTFYIKTVNKQQKQKKTAGNTISKLQIPFLRKRIFNAKPTKNAWKSYTKYTVSNTRPNLFKILLERVKQKNIILTKNQ